MTIREILIMNNVVLSIGIAFIIFLMIMLFRAEWKLAKHDESCFFKRNKRGK